MKTAIMLSILLMFTKSVAQVRSMQPKNMKTDPIVGRAIKPSEAKQASAADFFGQIQGNVSQSLLNSSPANFAHQVYVNINGGESGYFSANQVLSVLQNYFSPRKFVSFSFSRMSDEEPSPYATGRFTFIHKGNKESVQIYISLTLQESKWVISQFNIY